MDRCLDRLEVKRLPVVVLTHFHADHVDGLPGLLQERPTREILVTPFADPLGGAEAVTRWARAARVPVRVPAYGEVRRLGPLTWQVLGPSGRFATGYAEGEGSPANNASVVLLVETHGIRMLLGGDLEPEAQAALHKALPSLSVDVLKVPHHGSRYQDPDLLSSLGARLAIISVGKDNTYGHPASETLDLLRRSGMLVRRTDESGDVAVVVREGQLTVRELRTSSSAMR
jgi:competence protein ComEC